MVSGSTTSSSIPFLLASNPSPLSPFPSTPLLLLILSLYPSPPPSYPSSYPPSRHAKNVEISTSVLSASEKLAHKCRKSASKCLKIDINQLKLAENCQELTQNGGKLRKNVFIAFIAFRIFISMTDIYSKFGFQWFNLLINKEMAVRWRRAVVHILSSHNPLLFN